MTRVREISYSADLLSQELLTIGTLSPDLDRSVPVITNNVNRAIKRAMDGFVLKPSEFADVNTLSDRVKIWGTINGVRKPLGVFMWTDSAGERHSYGLLGSTSLVDLNGTLDQPIGRPVGWPVGTAISDAIISLAQEVGINTSQFPAFGRFLTNAANWSSDVSRASIMAQLANIGGHYSPYFRNDGFFFAKQPPGLDTATLIYSEANENIIADPAPLESNDLLTAPNRWVCEVTGANDSPIWAAYDVPPAEPHSFANRGFYVVKTVQAAQGVETSDECYETARMAALSDNDTYEWVEFDSPPSHDHDTFEVVSYRGVTYRQQEWSLPLSAAATMHHSLRRHYE